MIPLLLSFGALIATMIGGLAALRLMKRLPLILGFSAGAVLGLAFFDLLPEALRLGTPSYDPATITGLVALGFLTYLLLNRWLLLHPHGEEDCDNPSHLGPVGAATLSIHSFLDGVAIGVAFQVSNAVGLVVAIAVLVHDFSDGLNTVGVVLRHQGQNKQAQWWLAVDALAPVLGVLATRLFHLPEARIGLLLAIFAGFFLYIGAADLLPESHRAHPRISTTFMTLLGALTLFLVVRLSN